MNGKEDGYIALFLVFVMFMINVKYPFMAPFTNSFKLDGNGQAIVETREESIRNAKEEAARVAKLAEEASKIKDLYAKAYKDCNGKSYEKYGSTSAISVEYTFNSYTKTCSKTTMTGDLTPGTGSYHENFKITYETAFVLDIPDYMLVYRQ